MKARVAIALTLGLTLVSSAAAQTVIVNENFDGYADRNAFLAKWVPTVGAGTSALATTDSNYLAGLLTDDAEFPSSIPDVQGKAVDHVGATASTPGEVNQWMGAFDPVLGQTSAFTITPSPTQNVFLKADIYVGNSGNERMTVGLRFTAPDGSDADTLADTVNILELGEYNANPTVLGIPNTEQQSAGYAFRVINFGTASPPLPGQPNWQYFKLDPALDRTTDTDSIVNIGDIGPGWHTYSAEISPTDIKLSLDLFRDGFKNVRDEAGNIVVGSGTPGVDAEIDLPIATLPQGFNNLRIGGPSGNSSPGTGSMGFDNILLQLQSSVVTPTNNADFNNDGKVDGADFLVWQQGQGLSGQTDKSHGDANGDGSVNAGDLAVWQQTFGTSPTAGPAVTGVPEPASVLLTAVALLSVAGLRRR